MQVDYNPDDYECRTESHTCDFHKENPGVPYAGCTCWGSYSMHKKVKKEKKDGDQKVN